MYAREYYLKNRYRILSPENKENRKKIAKKYYEKNKEKILSLKKSEESRKALREAKKRRYHENIEYYREKGREEYKKTKDNLNTTKGKKL